jgi:hypothetical protein
MAATKSISDIIEIAETCLWLGIRDIDKQSIFSRSGAFKPQDVNLLKWATRRVKWMQAKNPNYSTLRKTANYLYSLCGAKNAAIAENILQIIGGQVIYDNNTGQLLNGLLFPELQFVVGGSGSPLSEGDTEYTITDARIIAGTLDVFAGDVLLPQDLNDQFSFSAIYAPSSIHVTFNQPLVNGQVITFKYIKGGQIQGSVTKSTQPTLYDTPAYGETFVVFPELVNIPLEDIISVFMQFPRRPVGAPTSNMGEIQYTAATGRFDLPSGDIFTGDQVIMVSYMV